MLCVLMQQTLSQLVQQCAPMPRRTKDVAGKFALPASAESCWLERAIASPLHLPDTLQSWVRVQVSGSPCGSSEIDQQSYVMTIDASGAAIQAGTAAGVRFGLATLLQLVRVSDRVLPCGVIEDWPAISRRGLMLDVSRDRVPTMRELCALIDTLAQFKCNHLQFYVEHTFAYAGHEDAWREWSAITPDEMRRLDAYAAVRGIEIAANQNCFGHLAHWLRLPAYEHLAETTGDWMFDVWPRSGPFSLCPTEPASLALVRDLIAQQARCVKGELFNIGCDEVYDIAYGRSKSEVERRGRVAVFAEFVRDVARAARDVGKRPMFWADVILTHADEPAHAHELVSLRELDMVALVWGYEPDTAFDVWVERVHKAGLEAWVCPGTSSWRAITGRTREREGNVAGALAAATKHNARGFLLCEWGDVGHWQQWPVAMHAIAQGIAAAWSGELAGGDASCKHARHVFGGNGPAIAAWLQELGDADVPLRDVAGGFSRKGLTKLRNASAMFASLHNSAGTVREIGHRELWRETLARLRELGTRFPACADALIADELRHTLGLSIFACERALLVLRTPSADIHHASATGDGDESVTFEVLRDWLDVFEANHRRLWLARSRSGGLEESCKHFATIKKMLEAK